jgi:hypothetical protein
VIKYINDGETFKVVLYVNGQQLMLEFAADTPTEQIQGSVDSHMRMLQGIAAMHPGFGTYPIPDTLPPPPKAGDKVAAPCRKCRAKRLIVIERERNLAIFCKLCGQEDQAP